jgi:hypothetical protein
MIAGQLCFEFAEPGAGGVGWQRGESGVQRTTPVPQNGQPELRREVPAGAERLLAALVRRGLHEGDLRAAARLCLLLDEGARHEA